MRSANAKRPTIGALLSVVLVLAGLGLGLMGCSARKLYDGPLVQNVSTDGFSVVWWCSADGDGELRLRGHEAETARFSAVRHGDRFEARATGLKSGATYWYEITHSKQPARARRLHTGQASTAPPAGRGFSFVVFADSGGSGGPQYRLAGIMNRYPADLILHAGDLVYEEGASDDYHRQFFEPYHSLVARVPFYPVMGNHDIRTNNGQPLLNTFSLPTNGPPGVQAERCYWFDYGDARFVAIDSTLDAAILANTVAPWLLEVLQSSSHMWKFVFFHHPPWAGGTRPANTKILESLVPVIEAGGVDMVFTAHNHLYERTYPMLAGEIVPTGGVRYITSAAGGKSLHKEEHGDDAHVAAFNDSAYSFTWIGIDGAQLELMQISDQDEILDRKVLRKDGHQVAPVGAKP